MRIGRRSLAVTFTAAMAGLSVPAAADDTFVKVIPPGTEKLVGEMLGGDAPLPGGCKLDRAAIDRTKVVATYACGGAGAAVELHHPSDPEAKKPAARTAQFALVTKGDVPAALLDDLVARVTAKEPSWRWISAEAPGLGAVADGPAPAGDGAKPFTPEQSEQFLVGVKLYREGKMREAFEQFRALARTVPENGVLGMVVASVASSSLDVATVDRFAAEADAHPDDTLAQFVAGVAAHYTGHRVARTRAEKAAYYERAIKYLSRTRPKFDFEPRVYVYLGVSHFRLGHQKEAEALIETAVPLAKNDPDVYYCRGEIFQRTNLPRAIGDIRTYIEMTNALQKQGVPVEQTKLSRVKEMLAHLEAVQRGEAQPEDLFDPLPDTRGDGAASPRDTLRSVASFGGGALAALGIAGVWMAVMRIVRRAQRRA
jgi:tetratricopeptide (TPR) repeat protein